jgi:hypothetical protein
MMQRLSSILVLAGMSVGSVGCGGDDEQAPNPPAACSLVNNTGCASESGLVCEEVPGSTPACFAPVHVKGMVFDLASRSPIAGARVVARDANNAADSDVAVTDAAGNYDLRVPTPRSADGTPLVNSVTLRADAAGYVTFPLAPRVAIPIALEQASGTPLTVATTSTDIGLLALPNAAALGTVSGRVLGDNPRGTLVIAGGTSASGGGVTGVASGDGNYTVFNVPAGSVTVRGLKVGLELESRTADVQPGATTSGIDLTSLGAASAVVSGKIETVNPGAGNDTSVILAAAETFNEHAARGEAPPGLRVAGIDGAFSIAGVPSGDYVVLAAFENDFLVRDPDTSIGGTDIVRITVGGSSLAIDESFKVTGALDVAAPDREQRVTGTPVLAFADDSGEDHYELHVFDAFGNQVWENLAVPGASGNENVEVPYAGPPLTRGMIYQFRATSIKNGGTPIARTEDLRGVFLYE